jgi:iron complex transport system substrate-binding protein
MSLSRRSALASLVVAAPLLLAACGGSADATETAAPEAGTVTVTDVRGEIELPANPENVVVMDMAYVDTLTALGVEIDALPKSSLSPADAESLGGDDVVDTGALKEPDFDSIASLDPDLIIVAGRSAANYDQLKEITPNVVDLTVDSRDYLESFRASTLTAATIFGKEADAEEQLAAIDEKIAATRELTADAGTGLVLMTSGGDLTAFGAQSRFGFVFDDLGLTPATEVQAEGSHGEAVSFEFVHDANPDHLFVLDRDAAIGESGQAAAAVLDNELVNATTAAQNDDIHMLDGSAWYIYASGLRTTDAMVTAVHDALA